MKKEKFYERLAIAVFIFFCVAAVFKSEYNRWFVHPRVGDIWRYEIEIEDKNPYDTTKPFYRDYIVLDERDGYVLYFDITNKTTESSKEFMFKFNARKIKSVLK